MIVEEVRHFEYWKWCCWYRCFKQWFSSTVRNIMLLGLLSMKIQPELCTNIKMINSSQRPMYLLIYLFISIFGHTQNQNKKQSIHVVTRKTTIRSQEWYDHVWRLFPPSFLRCYDLRQWHIQVKSKVVSKWNITCHLNRTILTALSSVTRNDQGRTVYIPLYGERDSTFMDRAKDN